MSRCTPPIHLPLSPPSEGEIVRNFVLFGVARCVSVSLELAATRASHSSALARVRLHSYIELYFDKCTAAGHYLSSSLPLDPSSRTQTRPASSSAETAIERSGSLTSVVKKPCSPVCSLYDSTIDPAIHRSRPRAAKSRKSHRGRTRRVRGCSWLYWLSVANEGRREKEKNALEKDG